MQSPQLSARMFRRDSGIAGAFCLLFHSALPLNLVGETVFMAGLLSEEVAPPFRGLQWLLVAFVDRKASQE